MSGSLNPRLVLVTREAEYDELLVRHATRGQAGAFLARRGQTLAGLDRRRTAQASAVGIIRASLPKGWRIAAVRRAELDRFLFAPEDVVVAVGQDGLVANLAKYLHGQPVIGVNADPERNPGILVPNAPDDVAALLPLAAAGTLATEPRTMLQAELDDGQVLLALNEVFIGHASHQSARYSLTWAGREEQQSSSGLIVTTGTGATGWALSISRATGVAVALAPDEAAGMFLVREPWPSKASGADLVSGRIGPGDRLLVASRMNEGGVVFADGIEHDRLDFGWGRTLTVRLAERQLRFVPGRAPPPATERSAPQAVRRRGPTPPPLPADPPKPAAAAKPPGGKRPWRRVAATIYLLAAITIIARACTNHNDAVSDATAPPAGPVSNTAP